jgi:hypothetical protein
VTSLLVLTSLDYLVMAAALTAVWSAFGAIPAALVFASLGLSFFARFDFIGGSILRWDWLAALLLGIAALARGAGGRAGLFFGYAALARIFPVLFLLPLAVKWLQAGVRRTPDARVARCLAVAAMVMTVVAGAIWLTAPTSLAREYTARIRLHAQLLDDNSVGLASLVAFNGATWSIDADGRVFLSAAAALAHRPPAWLLSAACVLYLAAALPLILKSRPLASLMYAVPLLFCAVSLSGYYYAFLVLLVLLPWERGRVSAVSVLQMALLSLVTAASFVFELIWQDLLPVFNAAGIQLALFFVLWLAFEYARLTATGARVVSVPADGTLSAAVPAR